MKLKLLTIAVPSYNVEKTLPATLDSLCAADNDELVEVLVINDGSTDGTRKIALDYAEKYPDTIALVDKENGGHGSAVNAGIANAKGKYFKVVDGDDTLDKDGLDSLIAMIPETDADLIVSDYKKVSLSDGGEETVHFPCVDYKKTYTFDNLPDEVYFDIHSITAKTEILRSSGMRLQEHTFYVDMEYAMLMVPYIESIRFLEKNVYNYYIGNPQQSVDRSQFVKRYDDHTRVTQRMVAFAAQCKASEAQKTYIRRLAAKLCFTQYMISAFYDTDVKRGKERLRQFDKWLGATDRQLYDAAGASRYIRFLRSTGFKVLVRGRFIKAAINSIYHVFKPFFGKKKKLTY